MSMHDRRDGFSLGAARVPQKARAPRAGVRRHEGRDATWGVTASWLHSVPRGVGQRVAWPHRHAGILVARRVLVVGGPRAIWS
jgi:hypothetical protein